MAIFSRRIMQTKLNENRTFIPEKSIKHQVDKLNSIREHIPTEWEVIVLNALSKIGTVKYEIEYKGPKKPDICFESPMLEFVADITTVSDSAYEKNNPVEYFFSCLGRFFKKDNLTTRGIHLTFGSSKKNKKVIIELPNKNNIEKFISEKMLFIRDSIKKQPESPIRQILHHENGIIHISYNPNNDYFSANIGGGYKVPYHLQNNPLYNRIKSKAKQLKDSKYSGAMGIFVCDGDCDILHTTLNGTEEFSKEEIIKEVFRLYTSLSFIITLSIHEKFKPFEPGSYKIITITPYTNLNAKYPISSNQIDELLKIKGNIPIPVLTPRNAYNVIKSKDYVKQSYLNGIQVMPNSIRISSRMFTELMAGKLSFDDFRKCYDYDINQFFLKQLFFEKMICNISVEKNQEKDDDTIVIEFGEPDAAITKYK